MSAIDGPILQTSPKPNIQESDVVEPSFKCENDDICTENENGVAKTNVTLYDLQVAIIRSFGVFAQIGDIQCDLISEDQGCNSQVVVLRNIWKFESLALLNKWPKMICGKLATLHKRISKDDIHKLEHIRALQNFHNVEIDVYKQLSGKKHVLEIYAAQKFNHESNKGFILMEYVEEATFCELCEHVSDNQLEQLMLDLAGLHSLTPHWQRNDHHLELNKKGFVDDVLMKRLTGPDSYQQLMKVKNFLNDDEDRRKLEELTAALRTIVPQLFQRANALELPLVFGHADLWNGNVIFSQGQLKAIIDYQTCHMVQLGFEFGRMFAHFASQSQRSRVLHFFGIYKNELDKNWPKNPVNQESFIASWELMIPFQYWLAIRCRGNLSSTAKKAKDPATAENTMRSIMKTMTNEAADALARASMKKEICLIDQCLAFLVCFQNSQCLMNIQESNGCEKSSASITKIRFMCAMFVLLYLPYFVSAVPSEFTVNFEMNCNRQDKPYEFHINLVEKDSHIFFNEDDHLAGPIVDTLPTNITAKGVMKGSADGDELYSTHYEIVLAVKHTCHSGTGLKCDAFRVGLCKINTELDCVLNTTIVLDSTKRDYDCTDWKAARS